MIAKDLSQKAEIQEIVHQFQKLIEFFPQKRRQKRVLVTIFYLIFIIPSIYFLSVESFFIRVYLYNAILVILLSFQLIIYIDESQKSVKEAVNFMKDENAFATKSIPVVMKFVDELNKTVAAVNKAFKRSTLVIIFKFVLSIVSDIFLLHLLMFSKYSIATEPVLGIILYGNHLLEKAFS